MGLLIGGKALQQLCKSGTNRAEINTEFLQLVVSNASAKRAHASYRGVREEELSSSPAKVTEQQAPPFLWSG